MGLKPASIPSKRCDPTAISIAKANARLNKIDNADFQLADVRRWKPTTGWDIIAANLYSKLLIEILPKLRRSKWLILSGVLHTGEKEFLRALRRKNIVAVNGSPCLRTPGALCL
jgi:ribosomal protein L11 methylase PrmA